MTTARIALDAFGGDDCPRGEVAGAVAAAREGVHITLVGDRDTLRRELDNHDGAADLPIDIRHASQVITMDDSPSKAVRAKTDASMPVCFDLVKAGDADAVLSAGNSGAMLACGLFKYRRIKGIDRPALVASLPTQTGWVTLLDVGANVECRPINFTQFAVLGAVYSSFKHGRERPTIGLLCNGTEEGKGTDLTRAVHKLLGDARGGDFDYQGYIEGDGLFRGEVDVVITDGWTGNIALKIAEATGRLIGTWLRRSIYGGVRTKIGAALMKPAFAELKTMLDPDSYGAAPLLGVGGMAFICHGGSSPRAFANALEFAARSVSEELMPQMQAAIDRHGALFEASKAAESAETKGKTA